MSKNITYLLGAGASIGALPIVDKIPNALNDFAEEFNPSILTSSSPNHSIVFRDSIINRYLSKHQANENISQNVKKFYNDIIWLKTGAENHTSIDTFAKKLYLQKDNKNLKKLKIILSCFFLYLQTKKFDKRYDSFFASILDDLSKLPENLKILSWNYDSQLEIAFNRFVNTTINNSKHILNLFSKGSNIIKNETEFSVFKINGTTGFIDKNKELFEILNEFDSIESSLVEVFLDINKRSSKNDYNPNMSFAWENFNIDSYFNKSLKESIRETEILIVIGYSFPFFNRKVDKLMLDAMPKLTKVYVQDPSNSENVIEKMKGLIQWYQNHRVQFESIKYKDQFFIPIEF
ncbi:hypothetical protein Q4Q39_06280 [Flavivirga amylovorans]|uniref:SIR2-like domain-containing protein n=1 Tax=Flavivirga amylovorans TaxID=870486 RepID=A0ABT8WZE8_9FLAO|nr:hypothetical protein [Flavivirga amylovorans]MDO5987012.1 hypothetical protein [Flavivirga amylovorans]